MSRTLLEVIESTVRGMAAMDDALGELASGWREIAEVIEETGNADVQRLMIAPLESWRRRMRVADAAAAKLIRTIEEHCGDDNG